MRQAIEVVQDAVPHAMERQIDLGYDGLEAGLPELTVPGNPTLLKEMIRNMVDNAVKYAVPGEIRVAAQVDVRGNLRLSVCDQGPGLTPEATRGLFERGRRGEDARAQGFGLGLWVARRIAQLHGGEVEVAASAQGGTCFTLVLPPVGGRKELSPR